MIGNGKWKQFPYVRSPLPYNRSSSSISITGPGFPIKDFGGQIVILEICWGILSFCEGRGFAPFPLKQPHLCKLAQKGADGAHFRANFWHFSAFIFNKIR